MLSDHKFDESYVAIFSSANAHTTSDLGYYRIGRIGDRLVICSGLSVGGDTISSNNLCVWDRSVIDDTANAAITKIAF